MASRRASHSGSWYSDSGKELNKQLENWLNAADLIHGPARAIIAPHAGYQYCGACSAFAYRQISPAVVQRIFILGPSHHVRLAGCALSSAVKYKTPLYDLRIDAEVYSELDAAGAFERMSLNVDEDEHSIEMHLPFIAKIMEEYKDRFTIVPVLVGSLSPDREAVYGRIFARYLAEPQNLFIVSSDFCHWGQRFRYTFYDRCWGDIHQSITRLDRMAGVVLVNSLPIEIKQAPNTQAFKARLKKVLVAEAFYTVDEFLAYHWGTVDMPHDRSQEEGMDIIENLNPAAFTDYLKRYGNTICGRHPIGVLLQAATCLQRQDSCGQRMKFKFFKYAQSSQCVNMNDSSVSYAAGALTFE